MIYVTIPAHDEERTIGLLLWKVRRVMAEFERDYRVLVLDDASGDRTPEVLERYRRLLPLQVRRNEEREGYARSLETLLRWSVEQAPYPKRDVVVTLQADFSEHPEELVPMVKAVEGGADLVAGSTEGRKGRVPRSVRFARWAGPRLLGARRRAFDVADALSGFRAYRIIVVKKALRELGEAPLLTTEGWAANVELLERLAPYARRIQELPTTLRYDLHPRASRHRPLSTLRGIFGLRRALPEPVPGEAA